MTAAADEARAAVALAATENGSADDAAAALRALRAAAQWAVEAIAAETAAAPAEQPERGTGALRTLVGLDRALTALAAVQPAVSGLIAAALPGPAVEEYLRTSLAELTGLRAEIEDARRRGEELERRESEIRALAERHRALREKTAELRRLEQLGEALDELAGQQAAIDNRLAILRSVLGSSEGRLAEGTSELVTLTAQVHEQLSAQNRELLQRLTADHAALITAEAEHVRLTAETATATARLAELADLRAGQVAVLRARERADESVARALPHIETLEAELPVAGGAATERVTRLLERADLLLTAVEDALADALAAADGGDAVAESVAVL